MIRQDHPILLGQSDKRRRTLILRGHIAWRRCFWWVFIADTEATLKRIDVGVYKSINNNNICNEIEESLDPLNPCSPCCPCPWVIQLEFLSLALSNEGYFNTEKERLFGSQKWTQSYWDQTVPPAPPQVSGSF